MTSYFWCFSHGTMHESDWCTATTFRLRVENMDQALNLKRFLFGDAEFLHELPEGLRYIVTFYKHRFED